MRGYERTKALNQGVFSILKLSLKYDMYEFIKGDYN